MAVATVVIVAAVALAIRMVRKGEGEARMNYAAPWKPFLWLIKLLQQIGKPSPRAQVIQPAGSSQMENDYRRVKAGTKTAAKGCGSYLGFWVGMLTGVIPLAVAAYLAALALTVAYGMLGTLGMGIADLVTRWKGGRS